MKMLVVAALATALCGSPASAQGTLPSSRLALRDASGRSSEFWRSETAPVRWTSAPLANGIQWKRIVPGVESAEIVIAGSGEAWRTRVILVKLDPTHLEFSLDTAFTKTGGAAWNIKRVPNDAVFAINAGQFRSSMPWGRVVLDGRQFLPPERGPLAVTVVVDSTGRVHWMHDGDSSPAGVRWAFQSYPEILRDREVPMALRAPDQFLDVGHRDARLALARFDDGSLVVALTRFDGLGTAFKSVPFGLTVPEMAGLMGALGARDAVLLDGGISAQLVAGPGTSRFAFDAWRDVPLALIARSREAGR